MSFKVDFLQGCSEDKEYMTTHLLTGIVARKAVIDVIDKSSDMLSVELRNILQDLWLENLKNIGGLPVQSQQLDDVKFGLESMRKSRRLSEQLPPITAIGMRRKPEQFMERPVLNTKPPNTNSYSGSSSSGSGSHIIETYILKSVS